MTKIVHNRQDFECKQNKTPNAFAYTMGGDGLNE